MSDADEEKKEEPKKAPYRDARDEPPRPAFARNFPQTDAIRSLLDLFDRGDFAGVRRAASNLTDATDEERAAAADLISRTKPDPAVKYLFLFTAALLVFLSLWWMSHDNPTHSAAPNVPVRVRN